MGLLRVPRGRSAAADAPAPARRADGTVAPTGRRRSSQPLIVISQAKAKADALDGLERWKKRHPKAAKHIAEDDVLVDGMRGRSSLWYRVRVNLRHVPEKDRPAEEKPDPDYDLSQEWGAAGDRQAPAESDDRRRQIEVAPRDRPQARRFVIQCPFGGLPASENHATLTCPVQLPGTSHHATQHDHG